MEIQFGTGQILYDHSRNQNHGSINGADWTPAQPEYSGPKWYVSTAGSNFNNGSENNPFATIRHGIDLTIVGDTVYVLSGAYYENLNLQMKKIIVIGEQKENTIIDGGGSDGVISNMDVNHNQTKLSNLIQNGTPGVSGGGGKISNCIIKNNEYGFIGTGSLDIVDCIN